MVRVGKILIIFAALTAAFSSSASAATIVLDAQKTTLSHEEELEIKVDLSLQASDQTVYYLRGVFYKPDTSNYCGFTWNGSDWFKGPYTKDELWKNFYQISILDNAWQGNLKIKIDPEDSGCKESGVYKVKIQRFRDSGSSGFDEQNEIEVSVSVPTPTQVPTNTPTPTKKPTPTKTPKPTKKPTSTASSSNPTMTEDQSAQITKDTLEKLPTQKPIQNDKKTQGVATRSSTSRITQTAKEASVSAKINTKVFETKTKNNSANIITILGATLITSASGIYLYQKYKKNYE